MLITPKLQTLSSLKHRVSGSQAATLDRFTASSPTNSSDKAWQIARLRQKLPVELPKTEFSDLHRLLQANGTEELAPQLEKAYSVAATAHAGMTRQDGTPYIHHPARVCALLIEKCKVDDVSVLQAALLHDVVEDTNLSVKEIESQFGKKTAEYVDWLTKPSAEGFTSKEELNAFQAQRLARAPKSVKMIKVADRMDNVSDLHLLPPDGKMERYLKDTRQNYLGLAAETDRDLHRALDTRVHQLETLVALTAA